jgi:ATP-dependent Lon protease
MPASRWYSNPLELFDWVGEEDPELMDLLLPNIFNRLSQNGQPAAPILDTPTEGAESLALVPILPLRGVVVFPQTAVPLTIGQQRSIRLVDDATAGSKLIGLVASKDPELENPGPGDLYKYGSLAQIQRLLRAPDGTLRILVQGLERIVVEEYAQEEPYLAARIRRSPETVESGLEIDALARNARDQFEQISNLIPSFPRELVGSVTSIEDPLQTVYTIANFQRIELADAQGLLELDSAAEKLRKLVGLLVREGEVLQLGQKIQNEARSEIEKVQRDYFLREQMKAIQKELGEMDEQALEVEEFRKKIDEAHMTPEALKMAERELDRLARLPTAAAEYGVIRGYLDWLVSVPWSKHTDDNLEIAHAREVLDQDHFGLKDVKDRILEFLAIRKLRLERKNELTPSQDHIRRERQGVILCFVGPPGVGKTSLGQSIARAMERKFVRMSLGGMRDEAEIRGHRRTYIGALPGRILQSLRRIESSNPVFMLDEVDKLTFDFHGDPASALLEVLDPEQNAEFRDNYLEVAFDLSQVLFITTANTLETVPDPLFDRMEVIYLSGYTEHEKIAIAKGYLIPRQIRENALRPKEISFADPALHTIIQEYTREAGVRNLERQIGTVCRKAGTKIASRERRSFRVTRQAVKEFLGNPPFQGPEELNTRLSQPGVVVGLAWTPAGGDVLFIESTAMPGGKGFQVTGSIGPVMQESARAALSYVRSRVQRLRLPAEFFDRNDIHLHIPAGARPKDGPSAGVTIATSLVSLLSRRLARPEVGMTGELTLRGQVLPVGGIKEKVLAAHRSGIKTVILPKRNKADIDDVPEDVRRSLKFVFVDDMEHVLRAALEKSGRPTAAKSSRVKASTKKSEREEQGRAPAKSRPQKGRRDGKGSAG